MALAAARKGEQFSYNLSLLSIAYILTEIISILNTMSLLQDIEIYNKYKILLYNNHLADSLLI